MHRTLEWGTPRSLTQGASPTGLLVADGPEGSWTIQPPEAAWDVAHVSLNDRMYLLQAGSVVEAKMLVERLRLQPREPWAPDHLRRAGFESDDGSTWTRRFGAGDVLVRMSTDEVSADYAGSGARSYRLVHATRSRQLTALSPTWKDQVIAHAIKITKLRANRTGGRLSRPL